MMGGDGEGATLEVVLRPRTGRYDPDDERWRDQVRLFLADLQRDVGGVRRSSSPVPGTKGAADTVILALGSAGAFTAAVEMFRAWLGRDKDRSLELTWTAGGRTESISLQGHNVDQSALGTLAGALAGTLGGGEGQGPWPGTSTAPC